jgi:hypothetical protein
VFLMEMIIVSKKTKETKYRTVATVPKSNINRKADNLYRYSTPIHDHSLPCTGTAHLYMATHLLVLIQHIYTLPLTSLYRYSTPIHDHSLPCTGTGTSIKSGGVFIEMMRSCKCQLYMTTHFLVLVQTLQ